MSSIYRVLYALGIKPWEEGLAQPDIAEQITAMFDREDTLHNGRPRRALDLGCGSGIHSVALARRGWQVTAVDFVPKALARARRRAKDASVDIRFVSGDITKLAPDDVGAGFQLLLDFGTVHGLTPDQWKAVGERANRLAAPDGTLLMLAFAPGRRAPLPRGMSRTDIETAYPAWEVTDEMPQNGKLPFILKKLKADPVWYRLRRR